MAKKAESGKASKKQVRLRSVESHPHYPALREFRFAELEWERVRRYGAHAVGVGRKITDSGTTNRLCLRFYVAAKRPDARLSREERIPKTIDFFCRKEDREVELTTDVIESPVAEFEQVDPESRLRPVPGGASIGIPSTSGTLGGWVFDRVDDSIVFLSNEHVLGSEVGASVLQQSARDGGVLPEDVIGSVKRSVERSETEENVVDCAIGDPAARELVDLSVLEIGPALHAIAEPALDLEVEKYGQTSRHTHGVITDADWAGVVSGRFFVDCIRVDVADPSDDWSKGGDSGSLVFAKGGDQRAAVALHFAGAGTAGFACKIQNVFDRLELGTLSGNVVASLLDGVVELETGGEVTERTVARLLDGPRTARGVVASRALFARERAMGRDGPFSSGLARDLLERVAGSRLGARFAKSLGSHEAEIIDHVIVHGDVRRSAAAAVRPLLAGAVTTTEVVERTLGENDVHALRRLLRELDRFGSDELRRALRPLDRLLTGAEGQNLATLLAIDVGRRDRS